MIKKQSCIDPNFLKSLLNIQDIFFSFLFLGRIFWRRQCVNGILPWLTERCILIQIAKDAIVKRLGHMSNANFEFNSLSFALISSFCLKDTESERGQGGTIFLFRSHTDMTRLLWKYNCLQDFIMEALNQRKTKP